MSEVKTPACREQLIDRIREYADKLHEIARAYDSIRWLAEREESTEAFVKMVHTAGEISRDAMSRSSAMMELLFNVEFKTPAAIRKAKSE